MSGMTIEKFLLAKNRSAFDRVVKMMRSLVVKNQVEADKNASIPSNEAYISYEEAYEEVDSVLAYNYTEGELMAEGFTPIEAVRYVGNPSSLQHLVIAGEDSRALSFIKKKRRERVDSYIELNPYYRTFLGRPVDEEEYVEVVNSDKTPFDNGEPLYLHEVVHDLHPKTYNKLFVEREVDKIYEDYDYQYLKFLENPLTPYFIHNKRQFEICYFKGGVLENNELQCFLESYNIAREEILSLDYIEIFENIYDYYVEIMFLFILFYTFSLYCCKSLQRYAMRDYTDDEIYDIIDSNNLTNLKSLNMGLLRNVVNALPDLTAYTGTKNVIDIIFDVVADHSISVKEYYLEKRYKLYENGVPIIDDNSTYDKNVDLVFKENTIKKSNFSSFGIDYEIPYDSMTIQDDTWGGTQRINDIEIKRKIKQDIKLELLGKNFSSVLTKYISISKIVDMYAKTIDLTYKLGLFYQINAKKGNFLKEDLLIFRGMSTTALSVYAAWCLVFSCMNGMTDPDFIVKESNEITDIMLLRSVKDIEEDSSEMGDIEIDLGNGYKRTLKDFLSIDEIKKYMVYFSYNEHTSVPDILRQYEKNYEIIKAIEENIIAQTDYAKYNVWNALKKANSVSKIIYGLFPGHTTYSSYIMENDPDLWQYLEPIITSRGIEHTLRLKELFMELQESYKDYIARKTQEQILLATYETDIAGGENIEEIGLLFNQFMSYYTQIYRQSFNVGFDDANNNSLSLLYGLFREKMITTESGGVEIYEKMFKDKSYSKGIDTYIELSDYIRETLKSKESIDLVLEYLLFKERMKTLSIEMIELKYDKVLEMVKSWSTGTLALDEKVTFK
jgi:hypothetical protein